VIEGVLMARLVLGIPPEPSLLDAVIIQLLRQTGALDVQLADDAWPLLLAASSNVESKGLLLVRDHCLHWLGMDMAIGSLEKPASNPCLVPFIAAMLFMRRHVLATS
jgi:hypothetical protein